ncbi:MAG: hypothetical protein GY858_00055 [Candidatus Omnitrophica bacterium]|nr:hypothetical protein [Candidatus Omnitrophota bacterium]
MPTYDYQCLSCSHQFELFQNMSDAPISVCPECAGEVKRLIGSGSGMIFKGSGFFATDYKKSSAPEEKPPCSNCPKECPNAGKKEE